MYFPPDFHSPVTLDAHELVYCEGFKYKRWFVRASEANHEPSFNGKNHFGVMSFHITSQPHPRALGVAIELAVRGLRLFQLPPKTGECCRCAQAIYARHR
jgi:hypothetical protein